MSSSFSQMNAILENTFDAIVICEEHGTIRLFNPAAERVFGYSRNDALGMKIDMLLEEPFFSKKEEEISESLFTGKARVIQGAFEIIGKRKDGSFFPVELVISEMWQMNDRGEEERLFIGVFRDISERREMENAIIHQAHHDPLTGLPNRILFLDIISHELVESQRNRKKLAVMFLDLDRFKHINDTLGHDAGDKLLKAVAGRLKHSMRASDTVARIGGDEFNILLTDIAHAGDIISIAKKIIDSFKKPYRINGHEIPVAPSIGISVYPDDAVNTETILRNADIAMYHAKGRGGNAYQFYSPAMNRQTVERIQLEGTLRQALDRGELYLDYQPQFEIDSGRLVAAEALVRWRHPELGLLMPGRFIPIAEEIGFIATLDKWVLEAACAQIKAWQETGHTGLSAAVNLSAKDLHMSNLTDHISQILRYTGLDPQCLDLEITESTAMGNQERTIPEIARLAGIGVGISIDDYGTGCSSLSHLKRLPIHKLKIDRSFIKEIANGPDDRAIVSAITALSQNMKLRVIAEGVETEDQMSFLKSIGCHEAQGNLLSRPLPAKELEDFVLSRE